MVRNDLALNLMSIFASALESRNSSAVHVLLEWGSRGRLYVMIGAVRMTGDARRTYELA